MSNALQLSCNKLQFTGNPPVIIKMEKRQLIDFPSIYFSPIACGFASPHNFMRPTMPNPSIIHRRFGSIQRSCCQNQDTISPDNRQIAPFLDWRSRPLNHQLIINLANLVCLVTKWHPNRPIIDRRSLRIDRSGQLWNYTDNDSNVQSVCNANQCNRPKSLHGIHFRKSRNARDWDKRVEALG